MALTAALKAVHAVVDDAVAFHAAAETLVSNFRNTIAQIPLATRSSDAQPATAADRSAVDENLDLAQRAASATKTQLDGAPGAAQHALSTLASLPLLPILTAHPRRRAPPPLLQRQFQLTQLHWLLSWPWLRPIHRRSSQLKPCRWSSMSQLSLSMT
jgi:hypothetical protein